jgi:hypothetical protein
MVKRPAWLSRRIATQKALKSLPRCEYTEGCEGRAMGIFAKLDPFRLLLACVKCASAARDMERQKVRNQPAPRSGT